MRERESISADDSEIVKAWFERVEARFVKSGFYEGYPLNEFWRKINKPQMLEILNGNSSAKEMLRKIQQTFFFVLWLPGEIADATVDWHAKALERDNGPLLDFIVQTGESAAVPEELLARRTVRGKRFFMDTFRVARIAANIQRYFALRAGEKRVFFELGPGLGYLARQIKHAMPDNRYILCDLPVSLCFSYLFIRANFPQSNCVLLDTASQLTPELLDEYDFIFAAPDVVNSSPGVAVDAFINTCSLGEMDNSVSSRWFDFVQDRLKPRYMYSLNRFLNHADDSTDYVWRRQENGNFAFVGPEWDVVNFAMDDEQFWGPYACNVATRNLELALRRGVGDRNGTAPLDLARQFLLQDWVNHYREFCWAINYRGAGLNQDLSMTGALFALWDCARRHRSLLSYIMLLGYLDYLNISGSLAPFEETFFLEDLLKRAAERESLNVCEAVKGFITVRQERRAKGMVGMQDPNCFAELGALVRMVAGESPSTGEHVT